MDSFRLLPACKAGNSNLHFGNSRTERVGIDIRDLTHHGPGNQLAAKAIKLLSINAILQNRKG